MPKKSLKRAARRSPVDLAARIRILSRGNPCRPGTGHYDRFRLYRNGITVRRFIEKGGIVGDVRYDRDRGHIELA